MLRSSKLLGRHGGLGTNEEFLQLHHIMAAATPELGAIQVAAWKGKTSPNIDDLAKRTANEIWNISHRFNTSEISVIIPRGITLLPRKLIHAEAVWELQNTVEYFVDLGIRFSALVAKFYVDKLEGAEQQPAQEVDMLASEDDDDGDDNAEDEESTDVKSTDSKSESKRKIKISQTAELLTEKNDRKYQITKRTADMKLATRAEKGTAAREILLFDLIGLFNGFVNPPHGTAEKPTQRIRWYARSIAHQFKTLGLTWIPAYNQVDWIGTLYLMRILPPEDRRPKFTDKMFAKNIDLVFGNVEELLAHADFDDADTDFESNSDDEDHNDLPPVNTDETKKPELMTDRSVRLRAQVKTALVDLSSASPSSSIEDNDTEEIENDL